MKAEELRIGNIVYDKGWEHPKPIGATDIFEMKVKGKDNFDPIKLDHMWLEKLGFIGLNHLGKREYSLVIDEELTIEVCFYDQLVTRLVTRNENCDENIPLGEFLTYREIKKCCFIHQLQNLYFSLTGKEIELKDPIEK